MGLYAIGDLHLSFKKEKTMDKFGENWVNHDKKIQKNWIETVKEEDTIVLLGDTSWAVHLEDVRPDLEWISSLEGKKIVVNGNHDYWWSSTSRLQKEFPNFLFLKNDFTVYKTTALCASRGWLCPNDTYYTPNDLKIYNREQMRLKLSINRAVQAGYETIILFLHFPPTNDKKENSGFMEIIKQYPQIKKVVYAHLHGKDSFDASIKGVHENIEYFLVSSDYLDFKPKRIL